MANNITTTEDSVHLYLITPIYEMRNRVVLNGDVKVKEPYQKLVKELRTRKWIKKDAIVSVDDYVNSKHQVSKNRSIIFDKYSNKFYAADHSIDEVVDSLNKGSNPKIGFNK
jgi:hypothetical protein